jgi:hypothetical protein
MRFMIVTYETEEMPDLRASRESYWAAWRDYGMALSRADVLVALNGLQPVAAGRTASLRGGQPTVRVAPGADPRAVRARYFILDVADIGEAMAWALRCPAAANGDVEVRPVLPG